MYVWSALTYVAEHTPRNNTLLLYRPLQAMGTTRASTIGLGRHAESKCRAGATNEMTLLTLSLLLKIIVFFGGWSLFIVRCFFAREISDLPRHIQEQQATVLYQEQSIREH